MARNPKSVIEVTKACTKKGKLKGDSKKKTKTLIGICPHHKLNKKGKIKPTIFSNDGEYCICSMCGEKFPGSFYNNDQLSQIIGDMKELNNQNKYTSVAINAGDQTVDFFAQMGVMLNSYKKNSKKVRNVAERQGSVKKKKNKNRGGGNGSGSSMYGSWGQK